MPAGTDTDGAIWRIDVVRTKRAASRLVELAAELRRPLEQLAVNWLATQSGMGPVIAGAQNVAQMDATAGAGTWELTSDEPARVDGVLADIE